MYHIVLLANQAIPSFHVMNLCLHICYVFPEISFVEKAEQGPTTIKGASIDKAQMVKDAA